MPVEMKVFLKEMTILSERFDRGLTEPVLKIYYDYLNAKLNTVQFVAACQQVCIEDNFFPSPRQLAEKMLLNVEDRLSIEWEKVMTAIAQGVKPELTEVGSAALRGVGGSQRIGAADLEREIPNIRREFAALYRAHNSQALTKEALLMIEPVIARLEGSHVDCAS